MHQRLAVPWAAWEAPWAVPWADEEEELRDALRALRAEPRAGEEVVLQWLAVPLADRSGEPEVPWADREAPWAVPWADREAVLPDGPLRALLAEPRADEVVALQRAAGRSAEPPARANGCPLGFLRSPSSLHVPPTRLKFLQLAGQIPAQRPCP